MTAVLDLRGIRKSFGSLKAVDDVTVTVDPGEIVSVVGENGAGKTTLMNVACGLYRPDAGEIRVRGEAVALESSRDAIRKGIGMVHQHFMLVPTLSLAENVVLGQETRRGPVFDRQRAIAVVNDVAQQHGLAIDAAATVEEVGVGMQQRAEIVKALYRRCDVLILDEPTAMLTPQEAAELLEVLKRLAQAGKGIVLVSHRLKEVLAISQRVAVMRRGKLVGELKAADATANQLAEMMVGRATTGSARTPAPTPGQTALAVRELSASNDRHRPALNGVSFELRQGEILGIAGVDGNGQAELVDVITGLRAPSSGDVSIGGKSASGLSPRAIRELRVGHVPEDRQHRGLLLPMSVAENFSLGRHRQPPFAKGALVDREHRDERARKLVAEFDVRPIEIENPVRALSGGNQQKVILGRELDADPDVVVAVQPTRGLDVGAAAMVHDRLREATSRGKAVLLVSLDLDEILDVSDRILVLFKGKVAGQMARSDASEERVGRLMLGQEA